MRQTGACNTYAEKYTEVLVEQRGGKRKPGRPRRRWEDNTKIKLQNINGGVDRIGLVQDRDKWQAVLYSVMNLQVA